jgi:SAM-dependent methyltransferase
MGFDRIFFGVMYRLGFTPWEGHKMPTRLLELVEGPAALPKGKALDLGCGTGDSSIYLAQHGWEVIAVDFVNRALDRARAKTKAAGVTVQYMQGDVTRLRSYGIGEGFPLISDLGCLHGLSDEGREAYVREVSAVAAPGARLVLAGFAEGKRRGPRGFNRPEVERRFADQWDLLSSGIDEGVSTEPDNPIYVYDLRRK